ncbi:MAG: Ig-like domain-containing protein [Actinomycetota bacterium]
MRLARSRSCLALGALGALSLAVVDSSPVAAVTSVVETSTEFRAVDNSVATATSPFVLPVTVDAGDVPAGEVVVDVDVTLDFQSISGGDCGDPTAMPPTAPTNVGANNQNNEIGYALLAPDGTRVVVQPPNNSNMVGGVEMGPWTSADDPGRVQSTFDDEAAAVPGVTPETGSFRPFQALNAFDGLAAVGDWTLQVWDSAGGDFNCHFGWTLTLTTGPASPSPTLTPADDAADVALDADLVLSLDRDIQAGTGDITLFDATGAIVEQVAVGAANVTITGSTLTFDPTVDLASQGSYYVIVDAGAITDTESPAGAIGAITSPSGWNFTTADVTAPMLVSVSPTSGAAGVDTATSLSIVFDEGVQAGTGTITLFTLAGDVVEVFDVSTDVVVSTTNVADDTITVTPGTDPTSAGLVDGTTYYVQIASGAVVDLATSPNPFAGISDNDTWRFTTAAAPPTTSTTTSTTTTSTTTTSTTTVAPTTVSPTTVPTPDPGGVTLPATGSSTTGALSIAALVALLFGGVLLAVRRTGARPRDV